MAKKVGVAQVGEVIGKGSVVRGYLARHVLFNGGLLSDRSGQIRWRWDTESGLEKGSVFPWDHATIGIKDFPVDHSAEYIVLQNTRVFADFDNDNLVSVSEDGKLPTEPSTERYEKLIEDEDNPYVNVVYEDDAHSPVQFGPKHVILYPDLDIMLINHGHGAIGKIDLGEKGMSLNSGDEPVNDEDSAEGDVEAGNVYRIEDTPHWCPGLRGWCIYVNSIDGDLALITFLDSPPKRQERIDPSRYVLSPIPRRMMTDKEKECLSSLKAKESSTT